MWEPGNTKTRVTKILKTYTWFQKPILETGYPIPGTIPILPNIPGHISCRATKKKDQLTPKIYPTELQKYIFTTAE